MRLHAVVTVSSLLLMPVVHSRATPEQVKRGAYLVSLGGCNDCHSPKVLTPQGPVVDTSRLLSGHPGDQSVFAVPAGVLTDDGWGVLGTGDLTAWAGPWGTTFGSNLTPDATGLGSWSEDAFIKTMRTGKHWGTGRDILPPMPWQALGALTDDDLKALFAYLRSIRPVHNVVGPPLPPAVH
jgi:hypothetical protein